MALRWLSLGEGRIDDYSRFLTFDLECKLKSSILLSNVKPIELSLELGEPLILSMY